MVRSSTTQLAVACRCLVADFQWMVSGTPLHGGVDDLNGELAFLGVWPFCLSDQTDGFWSQRIGRPWAAKEADALPLLHALLKGVIVRHTKAQRRVGDDTPLLTLPTATRRWRYVSFYLILVWAIRLILTDDVFCLQVGVSRGHTRGGVGAVRVRVPRAPRGGGGARRSRHLTGGVALR